MIKLTFFTILFAFLTIRPSVNADWPQWRGPNGQGIAFESKVPIEWSETKNIAWRAELPGRGWSSPLIVGNHVWITAAHETRASEEQAKERLKANTGGQPLVVLSEVRIHATCIDKESGKVLKDIEVLRKRTHSGFIRPIVMHHQLPSLRMEGCICKMAHMDLHASI